MAMGLTRIPVWVVDVGDTPVSDVSPAAPSSIFDRLYLEDKLTFIRCYARSDNTRIPVADVARNARMGSPLFGIKGTRHVAVVEYDKEVILEEVAPRVEWILFQ
jgi:hypothetical protein